MIPFNPFSSLTSKIYGGIAIAALSVAAIEAVEIHGFLFIKGYKQKNEELFDRLTKITLASEEARRAAEKQKKDTETKYSAIAKETDDAPVKTVYVERSNANADRMRLDKVCRSNPASPSESSPAESSDGPGADSIVVSRADYTILNENTGRLMKINEWGQKLLDAGLAKKADQ